MICQRFGRWPFPNPPEEMTQAQMIMYAEGLAALRKDEVKPVANHRPKRLRGRTKEEFYQFVEQSHRKG